MNNISIIIPCKDDIRIIDCVKSINIANCEILIIYNGATDEFIKKVNSTMKLLKNIDFHYLVLKSANLSKALEVGTQKAQYENVLYMDSDCIFDKKALISFETKIKNTDMKKNVLKGQVIFEVGNTKMEKIISESRTHHTAEVLTAYKPPLLISKKILDKIGGYAFDPRLIWREDSDLDYRIRQAGIGILPVENGIIYHHTINLKTDLRSTFRYGIGLAISHKYKIKLTEVPRSTFSAFKSKGLPVAIYMFFRNRIYNLGYIYAWIKMIVGGHFG